MKFRERLRYYRTILGSREKDATLYDGVYSASSGYQVEPRDSVYRPLWDAIVTRLRAAGVESVLDLGCGPGQLAALLRDEGVSRYLGIDFSTTAIALARKRCPEFEFRVADLNAFDLGSVPPHDAVIATEVLEHLKGDRELLQRLPHGSRFVGLVPAFNAESHVRYFPHRDDVVRRYRDLFDDLQVEECQATNGAQLYVLQGIRR